jgi:predicted transcriptional regulator
MKELKVAIMSKEEMKEYTLKVAKGEIKPDANAPKIFFPSVRAMAEALNENNRLLMESINKHHPVTINELAALVHKDTGNVSRALKRLENYGLVKLEKTPGRPDKTPTVIAEKISVELSLIA